MNIQSFAQLKRELKVGTKVTLIDTNMLNHKALGVEREVIKQQTNAVKFSGGSWLGLGSTGEVASDFTFSGDTFTYTMPDGDHLTYKFTN